MNEAPANPLELAGPQRSEGWSFSRLLAVILLAFAAHAGFILAFGERRPATPRAVANVPQLQLAQAADELLALNDPTLFARPHPRDFAATAWLKTPDIQAPSFRWTEPPRWLPFSASTLGAAFNRLMLTNAFISYPLHFQPALTLSTPALPIEPLLPQESTLRIEGELAQRQVPAQINLPDWPVADVLSPSVVQVLVNPQGKVVSAVLLPSANGLEPASHFEPADQRALLIARSLRFTPSTDVAIGRIIFHWHTVPPEATPNGDE